MAKFLVFVLCWIFVMALIGGALMLTQKFRKDKDDNDK